MINYSIYNGDAQSDTKNPRNAIGLISDGSSNYKDLRELATFIYVKVAKDVDAGAVIFLNNETKIANDTILNNRPAIMLSDIKANQYGWALLSGLYEFKNLTTTYGGNLYLKDGKITAEESDYSLLGSYFINDKGLAYIKD